MRDAVERLLESPEPAIRRLARRGLLGEESTEDVLSGALVQALLVDRPGRSYAKFWHYVGAVDWGDCAPG